MDHFSKFGFNEFYIAIGYKGKIIKDYFKKTNNQKKILKLLKQEEKQ